MKTPEATHICKRHKKAYNFSHPYKAQHSVHNLPPLPPSLSGGGGGGMGLNFHPNFQKGGTGPQLLEGGCWERGGDFFRGGGGGGLSFKFKQKKKIKK